MNRIVAPRFIRAWTAALFSVAFTVCATDCFAADDRLKTAADQSTDRFDTVIVRGASGTSAYGEMFDDQVREWQRLCQSIGRTARTIGGRTTSGADDAASTDDRQQLLETLGQWQGAGSESKWLIFVGHGVSNPSGDYFNLEGPDVTAKEIAALLPPADPLVVVCGFSASGGWISSLGSGADQSRIVITATQSGSEQNFSRFGKHLAAVASSGDFDIDHDHQLSWLEAFVAASALTTDEYETDGRLISEHAVLEDNGDGQGVRADFFEQLRPAADPPEGRDSDGELARRTVIRGDEDAVVLTGDAAARRNELEQRLYSLREQKADLDTDEYYQRLLEIAQELAEIYQVAKSPPGE